MRVRAVLFDLDDTLIDERATFAAAAATAWGAVFGQEAPPEELAHQLRRTAHKAWEDSPCRGYCLSLGVFSDAGLASAFPGDGDDLATLRAWAPRYRTSVWRKVASRLTPGGKAAAPGLAEAFAAALMATAQPAPAAPEAIAALKGAGYRLAVVTNGAADLQRARLHASGLQDAFEQVVASTEIGYGKPHSAIYRRILCRLALEPAEAVMVGDHLLNDVQGARSAGLGAVWLQPDTARWPEAPEGTPRLASLAGLPEALALLPS